MSLPLHRPFASVLIANRGEIAVRIVGEAWSAGLRPIAVYSDADRGSTWGAVTAAYIGPAPTRDSYLNIERILAAAKATRAEAIHPGYGFLSENPDFAQAVIDAGLVWIGPSPAAIRAMADKGAAKEIARKADVPVIPGDDGDDQSETRLLAEARKLGWPVLIKAALGGGGRGQRLVTQAADFAEALASAKREALAAFASDRVILEKALDNVRHVEIQVFGDAQGNLIHLGERDCSIQRRKQKIIEEAPAPGVSEDLRARMGDAALRLARAVSYTNAGTVEFLLTPDGRFYFLEMNTRIQVEHPVTEEVTGLNLIRMQFDIAMGAPLPLAQSEVRIAGHAIEARVCAEDPADNFAPQGGYLRALEFGGGRVDSVEGASDLATRHYDSLLAKVVAKGETRDDARKNLIEQLEKAHLHGVRTNRNFLIDVLRSEDVAKARVDIGWLERQPPYAENNLTTPLGMLAARWLAGGAEGKGWRSTGAPRAIVILRERGDTRRFVLDGAVPETPHVSRVVRSDANDSARLVLEGGDDDVLIDQSDNRIHVRYGGRDALFEDVTYAPAEPKGATGANVIRAPMAGRIVKVAADIGTMVAKNQILVILEAMKMEHELRAAVDGVVQAISVKPGDQVAIRQTLVALAPV